MNFAVEHQSEQSEGGNKRRIVLNMDCVVFGEMAVKFESVVVGEKIQLSGFLMNKSARSKWPVMNIQEFNTDQ